MKVILVNKLTGRIDRNHGAIQVYDQGEPANIIHRTTKANPEEWIQVAVKIVDETGKEVTDESSN